MTSSISLVALRCLRLASVRISRILSWVSVVGVITAIICRGGNTRKCEESAVFERRAPDVEAEFTQQWLLEKNIQRDEVKQ